MYLRLQGLLLLVTTALAVHHAHFARQLETCDVSCGGGWCCSVFETCVPNPGDTADGGWSCIFQGASNTDGSPITDEPFNPSADAGGLGFSSIDSMLSEDSVFLSSLTSALSITSLSIKSVSAAPSVGSAGPTLAPGTSPTSPAASSTSAAPSEISSTSSPIITTSAKASSIPPTNTTSATLPPHVVTTSNTNSMHMENGHTAALTFSFLATALLAYLL